MADFTFNAELVFSSNLAPLIGIAGEAGITRGKFLYEDATDNLQLKIADNTTAAKSKAVGMALADVNDGQPLPYVAIGTISMGGSAVFGSGTQGKLLVLSVSGKCCPWSDIALGDYITVVGITESDEAFTLHLWPTQTQYQST